MRLCDALKKKEMDVRLRDRHVAEGKLNAKDVEKYLKSLPDDSKHLLKIDSNQMDMPPVSPGNAHGPLSPTG